MGSRLVFLSTDDAALTVDLDHGCRLASLRIGGSEVLVTEGPSPIEWGLYPMAPYAGRVRDGRFDFEGHNHRLPRTLGDHAIHGTVYLQGWERESDSTFVTDLGPPWPFSGFVRQVVELGSSSLQLRLEVHTSEVGMPASCGWHPWFRRTIDGTPLELDFRPGFMLGRDRAGITTRRPVDVPDPPWDDCFGGVERSPELTWPGVLRVSLMSDCDWWVVYNERDYAICVEPQTAPPDALNNRPFVARPDSPLVANLRMQWSKAA